MIKLNPIIASSHQRCVQFTIKRWLRVSPSAAGKIKFELDTSDIVTTDGVDGPLPWQDVKDPNKKPLVKRPDSKWDVYGAVCLQRMATITPISQCNPMEIRIKELLLKIEAAESVLSDHELRHREDIERQERLKKGTASDQDMEMAAKQSAQDYEDHGRKELEEFKEWLQKSSKTVQNDGDRRSINRHLEKNLTLIVKQRIGTDEKLRWLPPLIKHQDGETVKQTAQRALAELTATTPEFKVKYLCGLPMGLYSYNYPAKVRSSLGGKKGAKIFMLKGQLVKGSITGIAQNAQKSGLADEFCWLTTKELGEVLHPHLHHRLSAILYEEENPTVEDVLAIIKRSIKRKAEQSSDKMGRIQEQATN